MLADLCERISGGDVDVVSDAIGMDRRIGRGYLTGGFGYGGPCLPRDNVALNFVGKQLGASTPLLEVNDQYNRTISTRLVENLKPYLRPSSTVAVLGLAYKPLSHVIEESSGIDLCLALGNIGLRVVGYDPLVSGEAQAVLRMHALVTDSLVTCLQDAESILVTTPDEMFTSLRPEDCLGKKESITVVDFWRCMPDSFRRHPKIHYVPIGRCIDDTMAAQKLERIYHDHTE